MINSLGYDQGVLAKYRKRVLFILFHQKHATILTYFILLSIINCKILTSSGSRNVQSYAIYEARNWCYSKIDCYLLFLCVLHDSSFLSKLYYNEAFKKKKKIMVLPLMEELFIWISSGQSNMHVVCSKKFHT